MDLNNKIIGIAGNARSGKDTLGKNFEKILEDNGIKSRVFSFANELKKSVDGFLMKQLGISAFTEDEDEKKIIRPFLVFWGTDMMRSVNDNIWVEKLQPSLYDDQVNIITDVRFLNELQWVKDNNGFSVLLKRDGAEPANNYEEENNKCIADSADLCFHIGDFDDERLIQTAANEVLNSLIDEKTYKLWKTTCPL